MIMSKCKMAHILQCYVKAVCESCVSALLMQCRSFTPYSNMKSGSEKTRFYHIDLMTPKIAEVRPVASIGSNNERGTDGR